MKELIRHLSLRLYVGPYRSIHDPDDYDQAVHIYKSSPHSDTMVDEILWKYIFE